MNDEFYNFDAYDPPTPQPRGLGKWLPGRDSWLPGSDSSALLGNLSHLWQWDELAAEIGQESQARVVIAGLKSSGKSLLFNRLRGWTISGAAEGGPENPEACAQYDLRDDLSLESLGLFVLADLPPQAGGAGLLGPDLLLALGDPALVVYLLDGATGVHADDFRWLAALRAGGRPLIVALNKIDLLDTPAAVAAQAAQKLGMPVLPISALTGSNIEETLLPTMLDAAPRLAVPLGRELLALRRVAARRVIRQTAILSGLMGAQPVPILDIPLQAVVQVGVVMRVGAAYGQAPTGGMNREVMGTVISALGLRYLALALVKLIPLIGWAVSGVLCALMTFLLGEAAIRYYEAGGVVSLGAFFQARRSYLRDWRTARRVARREQAHRRRWLRGKPASADGRSASTDEEQIIPVVDETGEGEELI